MKNSFIMILKGMIIGIGQIIPGVSGGMLAISLGLYEKGIEIISDIFKGLKDNLLFLLTVGFGILLSVVFGSKVIKFLLIKFYFPTMLLFIGLIVGGVPSLIKKINSFQSLNIKNILISLITFTIIILISFIDNNSSNNSNNIFLFIVIGFIYAATMVIPGISGTAIMMLLGFYDTVINILSNLSNFLYIVNNFNIILPFGIGLVLGIIFVSKFMNYILKRHEIKTYYFIIGLVMSSIIILIFKSFNTNFNIISLGIGLILFVLGYRISKSLDLS